MKALTREEVLQHIAVCERAAAGHDESLCDWSAKAANWRRVLALLDERDTAVANAVAEEREAAARIADAHSGHWLGLDIAAAIRARARGGQ